RWCQARWTSGRILNINATSRAVHAKETRKLAGCHNQAPGGSPAGVSSFQAAASAVLRTSEITNKKPVARTNKNERHRSRTIPRMLLPGLGVTPQIALSAS